MTKAPKKKKSPRTRTKTADVEIEAKRAKAYLDMEPHLCDVVRMGEIASMLFDDPDQGRFIFASRTSMTCCRRSGLATTPKNSRH